jgi:hypothetical protein
MSNYTGHEKHIDWGEVSGMDLATKPRLLSRWLNSATRRNEERRNAAAARRRRRDHRTHRATLPTAN